MSLHFSEDEVYKILHNMPYQSCTLCGGDLYWQEPHICDTAEHNSTTEHDDREAAFLARTVETVVALLRKWSYQDEGRPMPPNLMLEGRATAILTYVLDRHTWAGYPLPEPTAPKKEIT